MQNITPMLWFDNQAEEAMNLYLSIFPNSKQLTIARYPEGSPGVAGTVMTCSFELNGFTFTALNGGPVFKFTEAISFVVNCKDQAEIDHYWNALTTDGGEESQCGWLKDKFGVSWQIVPENIDTLVSKPSAMQAMLKMKKIVISDLENA
ncbi:VOC family protein [Candidatus Peregrinibacteria bacterium]|nr:VOC family protein [Candidatus Peregrinibacteria bacterium]